MILARPARAMAAWAAALLLAGCADIQPQVAPPTAAADRQFEQDALLDRLREQDLRVATVAYRIVTANVALCSETGPQTGMVLHSALQYGPRLRAAARRAFGLGDRPAIEVIVPGGPADRAGLSPGDVLIAVGGEALPDPDHGRASDDDHSPASYAPVEEALGRLDAALARGEAQVTVRRGAQTVTVALGSKVGCAYDAQVLPSKEMNASADGRHVFVTTALLRYAVKDETLAVILGHEFAHDVLHHRQRLDRDGFARAFLGDLGSTHKSLITAEEEADYAGLYLAARAGYDISGAPEFWRQFAADYGDAWYVRWSHPGSLERAANLAAARDEILQKIRAGQPLVPTPARLPAQPG